jgi:Mrp family chromosome partitioning ATPase
VGRPHNVKPALRLGRNASPNYSKAIRQPRPVVSETVVAVAHQKGGVGKSTTTALLAGEVASLRPDWTVLVEDLDSYRHLTQRLGYSAYLNLVDKPAGQGKVRVIDTGPGDTPALDA